MKGAYRARLQRLAQGPTEQEVVERLGSELSKLKAIAAKTQFVSAEANIEPPGRDDPGPAPKSQCEAFWHRILDATVPVPTSFANTWAQKRALHSRLAETARYYRGRFLLQGKRGKYAVRDENFFNYTWQESGDLGEVADVRADSAHFAYGSDNIGPGAKRPLVVVALLDRLEGGMTIAASAMAQDGNLSGVVRAMSGEWFGENEPEPPYQLPPAAAGILALGDEVIGWSVGSSTSRSGHTRYFVVMAPVLDKVTGRNLRCVIHLE